MSILYQELCKQEPITHPATSPPPPTQPLPIKIIPLTNRQNQALPFTATHIVKNLQAIH